ncbi:MAG: shikimate dehydrogenase [Deltaproteobacteria bacterium]|nr:shikimate dehydrogenase [Deltaproteobacteria bacterium]
MKISGRTKTLGIFGDPIEQTLSPYMHNAAFEALGLDLVYAAFRVRKERLKYAVEAIRALDMPGANVTIPHKESVVPFLDEIDAEARDIGAVNTIVNADGRLRGFNTDGRGYVLSLRNETGFNPEGSTIIIVGAGGAARAIIHSLLSLKPKTLVIANRTPSRAESLASEFGEKFGTAEVKTAGLDLSRYLPGADLLVNTTSMGMAGQESLPFPSIEGIKSGAIVSDIVFRPLDTPLIQEATKMRLTVHRGLGMLVWQGALSFELWTGRKAPADTMKFADVQALGAG